MNKASDTNKAIKVLMMIGYAPFKVTLTATNAHVEESCIVRSMRLIIDGCNAIRLQAFANFRPPSPLANMDTYDMAAEWRVHNICYKLHILRSHTASVDINTDKPRWAALLYHAIGRVIKLFYK